MASIDACAAGCAAAADTCQYFTFVYSEDTLEDSGGSCYIRAPVGVSLSSSIGANQIYYKMIPTQDMAAQSVTRAKSTVQGKEVSNGWYMRWPVGAGEGPQGFDVSAPPSGTLSLRECLKACDMDATCTLVYYDSAAAAAKCVLKAAGMAARHRTAIHGISGRLVHGAPGPAGAACTVDADCESANCTTPAGTCAAGKYAHLDGYISGH